MTPQAILLAAADLIEREGWVQGRDYLPGCGYCAQGAITEVALLAIYLAQVAVALVMKEIGGNITIWNDRICSTKAEVIAMLRKAAA